MTTPCSDTIEATCLHAYNTDLAVKRAAVRGATGAETDVLRARILAVLADTQARLTAIGDDANALNPTGDGSVTPP